MNDFDSIEKDLKSLTPKPTPSSLIEKIETGLGDAGNLAMRRLPEEFKPSTNIEETHTFMVTLGWHGCSCNIHFLLPFFLSYQIRSYS